MCTRLARARLKKKRTKLFWRFRECSKSSFSHKSRRKTRGIGELLGDEVGKFIDSLTHWIMEPLIQWFIVFLVHWFTNSLILWFIESLIRSSTCARILPSHFIGPSATICAFVDAPHNFTTLHCFCTQQLSYRPMAIGFLSSLFVAPARGHYLVCIYIPSTLEPVGFQGFLLISWFWHS